MQIEPEVACVNCFISFDKTSTIWLFKFKLAILKLAFVTVMYVVCATVIPYHDCFVDDTMLVNVFSQV
jgi:hypothetical protein